MSTESQVAALLTANTALMAVLTGGVVVHGNLTPEGITRATVSTAFDANGVLKPIAVVRQRDLTPTFGVSDYDTYEFSTRRMVEVWLYQAIYYDQIDLAAPLVLSALTGKLIGNSYELEFAFVMDRMRDTGALNGASAVRIDFQLDAIMQAAALNPLGAGLLDFSEPSQSGLASPFL